MNLSTQDKKITMLSSYKSKNNPNANTAQISYFESGCPERSALEYFINTVFKKYYNAHIDHFYPQLLSIESDQAIKAVAGFRCAADETLFSEYYLSDTLENELKNNYGQTISRNDIVEVGNLAPANVGQMRWLIASITAFLYSAGFKYIVFTGVPGVFNAFKRMKIPLKQIIEARQECLPTEIKSKWGPEYYQLKPVVLSGDIAQGFELIKDEIYNSNQKLIPLFEKACQLGQQYRANKTGENIPFLPDNAIISGDAA
jgi:hypothetical protein